MTDSTAQTDRWERAQAVDRVLDILEFLANQDQPASLAQVAAALGVHRSVAYRMLRTLEDRRILDRTAGGYRLGEMLLVLANAVDSDLRDLALIELTQLATRFSATAFVTLRDGQRTVCLQTVEPPRSSVHVTIRPGTWGPKDRGAPAIAILAGQEPALDEPEGVSEARARGYAVSSGEAYDTDGLQWVAAPVNSGSEPPRASLCLVFPRGHADVNDVGEALALSAHKLSNLLR